MSLNINHQPDAPYTGKIIILNGASSAGKSSLAKALQKEFLPHPLAYLSIDTLMHYLPQSFFAIDPEPGHIAHQGLRWILPLTTAEKKSVRTLLANNTKNPLAKYEQLVQALKQLGLYQEVTQKGIQITFGPAIRRLMAGFPASISALAKAGNDIVVEHAFFERHWITDLVHELSGLPTFFIGLKCPLNVLEQREINRGHRIIGQTRGHHKLVHENMHYDLEIDTATNTPQDGAKKIIAFLKNNPNPRALNQLLTEMSQQ